MELTVQLIDRRRNSRGLRAENLCIGILRRFDGLLQGQLIILYLYLLGNRSNKHCLVWEKFMFNFSQKEY